MQYKVNSHTMRELMTESYLIEKGVRSCALMTITIYEDNEEELDEILGYLTVHNLYFTLKEIEFDDEDSIPHANQYFLYFYKYSHQKLVIEYIEECLHRHSFIYEYMLGTLLGYSSEEMEKFLSTFLVDQAVTKVLKDKENIKEATKDDLSEQE